MDLLTLSIHISHLNLENQVSQMSFMLEAALILDKAPKAP